MRYPRFGVPEVQVEHDAGVRPPCPVQEGLIILGDEPDGAVDYVGATAPEFTGGGVHESGQFCQRHVEFGNRLAALIAAVQSPVKLPVVAVDVHTQLEGVAVVGLPVGALVESGVFLKGARLVRVRQVQQPQPVLLGQQVAGRLSLFGPVLQNRQIAGEHAAPQEAGRRFVGHVLEGHRR